MKVTRYGTQCHSCNPEVPIPAGGQKLVVGRTCSRQIWKGFEPLAMHFWKRFEPRAMHFTPLRRVFFGYLFKLFGTSASFCSFCQIFKKCLWRGNQWQQRYEEKGRQDLCEGYEWQPTTTSGQERHHGLHVFFYFAKSTKYWHKGSNLSLLLCGSTPR